MHNIKRTLAVFLTLMLLFGAVSPLRCAAKDATVRTYQISASAGSLPSPAGADENVAWDGAFGAVLDMYLNCQRSADLLPFHIADTEANRNRLYLIYFTVQGLVNDDVMLNIIAQNGELIRLEHFASYTPNHDRNYKNYNACAKAADSILYGILGNDALSDADKCLLVHDRLAVWSAYNYADYLDNTLRLEDFLAYRVLAEQTGVCNGIAQAYQWLLHCLGIPCAFVESRTLAHAWNEVYLDGEGYFVDVTWDDPVWDVPGRAAHNNFLQSFETFSASHGAADFDRSPNSMLYEDYFSTAAESEIVLIDDTLYFLADGAKLFKRTPDGEIEMIRQMENSVSFSNESGVRTVIPGGRKIIAIGDEILYLAPRNVLAYNVKTGEERVVYTPGDSFFSDENTFLYGICQRNGVVSITANSSPEFESDTVKRRTKSFVYCNHPSVVPCRAATHPASCRTPADQSTICPDCRKVFQSTELNSAHHLTVKPVEGRAPDCDSPGFTAGEQCVSCKVFVSGHEELPAGHQITVLNAREATCTEAGYSGDTWCTVCGQMISQGTQTAALGHTEPNENGDCIRCGLRVCEENQPADDDRRPTADVCKWCGEVHEGFLQRIVDFFHRIFVSLFGAKF